MISRNDGVSKAYAIWRNMTTVIVGKDETCQLALLPLFCRGHLLLEDVPGVGKTTLAKSLALSIGASFCRIQFTPDLLPLDITGSSVFHPQQATFEFRQGPIFTNILLADEINRATPRTQSSLLECMEEFQVSVDGHTYPLPTLFTVIATMNPVEQMGTFPLPETQLDRFMMRISLGYPSETEEVEIFKRQSQAHPLDKLQAVASLEDVLAIQEVTRNIFVHPSLQRYAARIVRETRQHRDILLGCSPRATLHLLRIAQAAAFFNGEEYVEPDIIKQMAPYVLSHRIILQPRCTLEGKNAHSLIHEILDDVAVPVDQEA